MRYSGSKRRFMKQLTPILMEHLTPQAEFVDAFCGGGNVITAIPHPNKVGIEVNKYIVALWEHLQKEGMVGIPLDLAEQDYNMIKSDYLCGGYSYPDWLIGYVGACCSYGGAWFNGYARFNIKKNENHIREAYNGLETQLNKAQFLDKIKFVNCSYKDYIYQPNSVIYCDPPYAGRKKYESDFDNVAFWEWARKMSKEGHYVYVSEYEAPYDFKCIWSQDKTDGMGTTLEGNKQKRVTEKLFVYNSVEG